VGLRASLLSIRFPVLLAMLGRPLVVSAGVCGALDPKVERGTVVLPETVIGTRGERYAVSPVQHRRYVEAFERCGIPFADGTLATAMEIVASPDAKAALREATGAVAVDMESSVILRAASQAACPALVLRGVSDDARDSLPAELLGLVTPDGRMLKGRAAMILLRHPAVLPRALMLQRATQLALAAVAEAFQSTTRLVLAAEDDLR
jgi:adenosylhomocysteine nucleosidase